MSDAATRPRAAAPASAAAPLRVALGPLELSGICRSLADGLSERGHRTSVVTTEDHPFGFVPDRVLRGERDRLRFGWELGRDFDVAHCHFGMSWCHYADLAWARARGRLTVMHYLGSDVRTQRVARTLHPARGRVVDGSFDRSVRLQRSVARRLVRVAVVPDLELASYLLDDFRTIYLLPFAVDLDRLAPADAVASAADDEPLTVFHAPSNPAIKGSDAIRAAVERLATRRPVRLELVTNRPHDEALAAAARADIVVDQLNSETHGVFAVEAMALGKPVLCEYDRGKLAPFAQDSPLVAATAETLEARLEELVDDAERRRRIGAAGREHAQRVFSHRRVAAAAERLYEHARDAPPGLFQATPDGIDVLSAQDVLPEALALSRAGGLR